MVFLRGVYRARLAGEARRLHRRARSRLGKLLHLVHPRLRARTVTLGVVAADRFEFLEELFLPGGETDRGFDDDVAEEIAVGCRAHTLDSLAAQPEHFPALGFSRHLDLRVPL